MNRDTAKKKAQSRDCHCVKGKDRDTNYNEVIDEVFDYFEKKVNNVILDDVSERYLLIEWLNGNPMIDGSIYFDSKEDCLTYWQDLQKTDLFDITHTICRITNVR